jgi:hypothetical protein
MSDGSPAGRRSNARQKQAGANLEKHGRDQQRFTYARPVDNAADLHDGRVCVGADQPKQVIGEMERHV